MSGQEGGAPQAPLDLVDTRLRYDAYHWVESHTCGVHKEESEGIKDRMGRAIGRDHACAA
jgi:hypothetical protein